MRTADHVPAPAPHDLSPASGAWAGGAARLVPGYDGYADAKRRRATDRAVRLATAGRLREARDTLAAAGRHRSAAGRFDALPVLETLLIRLGRAVDRLEGTTSIHSGWLAQAPMSDDARAALVEQDRGLAARVDDLLATARALDPASEGLADGLAVVGLLVDDLLAHVGARLSAFGAAAPPQPPGGAALTGLAVGDTLRLAGRSTTVAGWTRWDRGDCAWLLGDPAGGLRLWRDLGGELAVFEAQAIAVTLPPPGRIALEAESFALAWADAGRGLTRGASGVLREAGPRWVYTGDAGGRLWVARVGDNPQTWLGLAVDSGEIDVLS